MRASASSLVREKSRLSCSRTSSALDGKALKHEIKSRSDLGSVNGTVWRLSVPPILSRMSRSRRAWRIIRGSAAAPSGEVHAAGTHAFLGRKRKRHHRVTQVSAECHARARSARHRAAHKAGLPLLRTHRVFSRGRLSHSARQSKPGGGSQNFAWHSKRPAAPTCP